MAVKKYKNNNNIWLNVCFICLIIWNLALSYMVLIMWFFSKMDVHWKTVLRGLLFEYFEIEFL